MATFRENSQQNWTGGSTVEHINAGSLQRIADAAEKMAANYIALQNSRDYYERECSDKRKTIETLHRRISSLQDVITKMKRKGGA